MRVAAIQMNSGSDVGANLDLANRLLGEAAADGCVLAVLPENFALMPERGKDKAKVAGAGGGSYPGFSRRGGGAAWPVDCRWQHAVRVTGDCG